jgi:hypothetical protein
VAPVYKTEINVRGNLLRWPRDTLYPQKLALTSQTSSDRSVGVVRLGTKGTDFFFKFPTVLDAFLKRKEIFWRIEECSR